MKKLRNEKGAITMITLLTVLFMVSFLITSYTLIANKVKTQKEMLAETKAIYEPKTTMEEIYNSYFTSDNIIPIYTVEQLLSMKNNEKINIDGKIYTFSNNENTTYLLKNDLKFNTTEMGLESDWIPPYEDTEFASNFDWSGHTIEVTTLSGDVIIYDGTYLVTANGYSPMTTISDTIKSNLVDYKIYGNSVHNGTPDSTNYVEIQNMGDKTVNLFNYENSGVQGGASNYINMNIIDGKYEFSVKKLEAGGSAYGYSYEYKVTEDMIGKTMRISAKFEESGNSNLAILCDAYQNSTYLKRVATIGSYTLRTAKFTIPENVTKIIIRPVLIFSGSSTLDDKGSIWDIMLSEGEAEIEYEPYNKYKIPIKVSNGTNETITNIYLDEPLRKAGEYADYIDFEKNRVVRNVGIVEVNGDEEWKNEIVNSRDNDETMYFYSNSLTGLAKSTGLSVSKINGISTRLVTTTINTVYSMNTIEDGIGIIGSTNGFRCRIKKSRLNTATTDGLNQWLQENPFEFYYPKIETEEPIQLPNIQMYKGKNTITVDTKIAPSNMSITYNAKQ